MRSSNILRLVRSLAAILAVAGPGGFTCLFVVGAGHGGAPAALALKEKHCLKFPAKPSAFVPSFSMSADGKLLAVSDLNGRAIVWDLAAGKERFAIETGARVGSLAFDPAGCRLAGVVSGENVAGERKIRFWDIEKGKEALALDPQGLVVRMIFHPNKKQIVTLGAKNIIEFRDVETGAVNRSLRPHRLAVTEILFSPDGKMLATASMDGTVKLIEDATGKEVFTLECKQAVHGISFHPSGKFLASVTLGGVKSPGSAKIWDTKNGELLRTVEAPPGGATKVRYSPDGKLLAIGSGQPSIRDAETGRELLRLEGQGYSYYCTGLAFNPEGTLLAAAFVGGTVKVWEVIPKAGPAKKK